MGIISFLCVLFALIIVPIILVMAFVAPTKLDLKTPKNPTGKHERKQSLIGLGMLWLIAVIVGGVTAPDSQVGEPVDSTPDTVADTKQSKPMSSTTANPPSSATIVSSDTSHTPPTQRKTLGITTAEFQSRFNAQAKDVNSDLFISPITVKNGEMQDSFMHQFNDAVGVIGTVDKATHQITGVTFIMGKSDNGAVDAITMTTAAAIAAKALSPDKSTKQTGGVVLDMAGKVADEFKKKGSATLKQNNDNVKYFAMADENMGFWFGFEPID